jgi:hypothetical protein
MVLLDMSRMTCNTSRWQVRRHRYHFLTFDRFERLLTQLCNELLQVLMMMASMLHAVAATASTTVYNLLGPQDLSSVACKLMPLGSGLALLALGCFACHVLQRTAREVPEVVMALDGKHGWIRLQAHVGGLYVMTAGPTQAGAGWLRRGSAAGVQRNVA